MATIFRVKVTEVRGDSESKLTAYCGLDKSDAIMRYWDNEWKDYSNEDGQRDTVIEKKVNANAWTSVNTDE